MSATQKPCAIALAAKLIGDEWIMLIARDLMTGPKRFNHFLSSIDEPECVQKINSKTLSQRLKLMETEGLIKRNVYAEVPVKVEYELTEKGQALSGVLDKVREYGEKYL
jgi:DNA-binding HxlR family transcriptional regulator